MLPRLPARPIPVEPPVDLGDEAWIQAGASLTTRICAGCHGVAAVSGGVLSDLRHSAS